MPVTAIRLQNFMGFVDTDWIELRPITLLFGKNSAGKSAIIRALLLLKQSLDAPAAAGPLIFKHKDGVDLGSFHRMVRGRIDTEPRIELPRYMTFGFRRHAEPEYLDKVFGAPLSADERERLSFVELLLSYYWNSEEKHVEFSGLTAEVRVSLESEKRQTLLETKARYSKEEFEEKCKKCLPRYIPSGLEVRFIQWLGRSGGIDLHDRFILTDIGGVSFGQGLGEAGRKKFVMVALLDDRQCNEILNDFNYEKRENWNSAYQFCGDVLVPGTGQ